MNIYSILFERLYAVFHKGASINPAHEKLDGAVLTSMILSIPVFFNTLSILHLLRIFLNINIYVNIFYGATGMIILMAFNLLYFLRKKKYLEASSFVAALTKKKRIVFTVISWVYFLGSFILFFFLLNIGKV
jgi:hypothetical protein